MRKINIEISGQDIEFMFGTQFLAEIVDIFDADIEEIFKKMQKNVFRVLPIVMYNSAFMASKRNGIKFGYNQEQFIDLLDDDGGVLSANAQKFLKTFTQSITTRLPAVKKSGAKDKAGKKK